MFSHYADPVVDIFGKTCCVVSFCNVFALEHDFHQYKVLSLEKMLFITDADRLFVYFFKISILRKRYET